MKNIDNPDRAIAEIVVILDILYVFFFIKSEKIIFKMININNINSGK